LYWPFTVWINCSSDLKKIANSRPSTSNFKSFSHSVELFFLTVSQNNFAKKYRSVWLVQFCRKLDRMHKFSILCIHMSLATVPLLVSFGLWKFKFGGRRLVRLWPTGQENFIFCRQTLWIVPPPPKKEREKLTQFQEIKPFKNDSCQIMSIHNKSCFPNPIHKDTICQLPVRWIYYCHSSESTGEKTGKTHLYAMWQKWSIFRKIFFGLVNRPCKSKVSYFPRLSVITIYKICTIKKYVLSLMFFRQSFLTTKNLKFHNPTETIRDPSLLQNV
jgi:hypothetical protein